MTISKIDLMLEGTAQDQQTDMLDDAVTEALSEYAPVTEDIGLEPPVAQEEVQVAGLGKLAKGIVSAAKETPRKPPEKPVEAPKADLPIEPEPTKQISPDQDPEEYFESLREQMAPADMPVAGKPPETVFNLDKINTTDDVKRHIEMVAQKYGGVSEKMNFEQVAEKVKGEGYSEQFIANVVNVNSRMEANPADVYRMMLALNDAAQNTMDLAKKVDEASINGTLNDELMVEFSQALAFEGALSRGVKGKQEDIARSLAIFNQARTTDTNRALELRKVVESFGEPHITTSGIKANNQGSGIVRMARVYKEMGDKESAHKFAEKIYPFHKRVGDIIMTSHTNNVLSGPTTHLKNMLANTGMIGLSVLEKQGAVGIGKLRNIITGNKDYMRQQEILVDIASWQQAAAESWVLAKNAFKNNRPITGASKVETRTHAMPFDIETGEGSSLFMKKFAASMKWYGKWQTMPGRLLMSEDEGFKAFNYRRHLNSLSYREAQSHYDELVADKFDDNGKLIKKGLDPEQALAEASEYGNSLMRNPPDSLNQEALDYAAELTFTKELEGSFRSVGNWLNRHPLAKQFALFWQTPMNIGGALVKRSPLAPLMKSVKEDWNKGGVYRDMAVSRVMTGGSLIGVANYFTSNNLITGAGPYSTEQKKILEAQGWQPYSIVIQKGRIPEETMNKLKQLTKVTHTDKYDYVSYAGLEPVGAIMGMGATWGEYNTLNGDADSNADLYMGLAAGIGDYMQEVPVFSGVNDFMSLFSGNQSEFEDGLDKFIQKFSAKTSSTLIGGTPISFYSSLQAYTTKVLNDEKVSYRPDYAGYDEVNPLAKGFLDALQKYRANNPFTNDALQNPLDPITGQVRTHPSSDMWERSFPLKLSEGKYDAARKVMYAFGVNDHEPDRSIDGIDLTGSQHNRWMELATGKEVATAMGEGVPILRDWIVQTYNDPEWYKQANADKEWAKSYLDRGISEYYRIAKEMLLSENRNLRRGKMIKKEKFEKKVTPKIEALQGQVIR